MSGSSTLEEVAGSMSRPLSAGTVSGHLAACLEAGLAFEWDRPRLGIDPALEGKVRKADTNRNETKRHENKTTNVLSEMHNVL